jgi:hypothetical protein
MPPPFCFCRFLVPSPIVSEFNQLENYWRAQRQGKAGHDSPWLFLGKKAGEPMGRYTEQNIYYSALKKSGVRRKGGIHPLRHYPGFRTIAGKVEVSAPNPFVNGAWSSIDWQVNSA